MSNNVAEVFENRASTLFDKLVENQDLANVVMGFLGRIILMCHQKGLPIEGVVTTDVNEFDDEFRFGVAFSHIVASPMGLWQAQGDILTYAKSRSTHLAKALERNAKIMKTFRNLIEAVDQYCKRKRISFSSLKVKKAFIHPKTNVCVIRTGEPDLKDRFR